MLLAGGSLWKATLAQMNNHTHMQTTLIKRSIASNRQMLNEKLLRKRGTWKWWIKRNNGGRYNLIQVYYLYNCESIIRKKEKKRSHSIFIPTGLKHALKSRLLCMPWCNISNVSRSEAGLEGRVSLLKLL